MISDEDRVGIEEKIRGKTIRSFVTHDDHGEDWFSIIFTDGSILSVRYDWVYEWEYIGTINLDGEG